MCRIYLRGRLAPPPGFPLPRGYALDQSDAYRRTLGASRTPPEPEPTTPARRDPQSPAAQPQQAGALCSLSVSHRLSAHSQQLLAYCPSICRKPQIKRNKLFILLRSFIFPPSWPWDLLRQSLFLTPPVPTAYHYHPHTRCRRRGPVSMQRSLLSGSARSSRSR